jgi:class 3 adenylate cyclase
VLKASKKVSVFQPGIKPQRWSRILSKFLLPIFLVWASIATISPQRLVKGNLKLKNVMADFAQDIHDDPELTATIPEGATPFPCPGPSCPLNPGDPEKFETIVWQKAKNYLAERSTTQAWRGYHYTRIDTKLPKFAAQKGKKVAFDILGIAGKSWRFFVNGVEKAQGAGGIFENAIIFESEGGTPGEPLVIGLEVKAGRTFAPGIIYLSQPFLSPPEIAPVIRTAYRGNDKEVVLPDAYARATVAVLAALGCLFTPFHLEILFFSASTAIWNYMRLSTNEMVPFPSFLGVDFTTLYAALVCLFNAASLAFLSFYFRNKWRPAIIVCIASAVFAPLCVIAGKTGFGTVLVTAFVNNEFISRGVIKFMGLGFAIATWRATKGIDTANFRRRIALGFAFVLGVCGILELGMQTSMWGLNIIPALNDHDNRWFVRKVLEASMASFGLAIALEWAIVVRERQTVLQRFGMIVDPRVLKELILNKKIPTVRAERVVALFVDLRGFTTLCEKESPQEVNLTLNEYLEVVTKAVQEHGGIIDKFVGDEVMALWGVPEQSETDPTNAVRSAMSIRRRLRDLNTVRQRSGREALAVGIGLHCGPAIVGPVGSAERIDFTAIGPTINVASRLQSLTKEKKTDILISSDLYKLVISSALVADLGAIKIRGVENPVTLYRVLGVTDDSGKMNIHDRILEAAGLPSTPGIVKDAPDNLFKAS